MTTPATSEQVARQQEGADVVFAALGRLAEAEQLYRKAHDLHGADDIRCGRAWDVMRRAGDHARAVACQYRLSVPA